ncbi:phosphatidylinositol glycan [Anaeramoeba flamelloides]|uniref:Phosphatidylinositol glycan n=1 Tax=Anaeramoeba flamelloides TaxID=1746091 RepID=A0AAV8A9Q8_9EUKA|nr:phosphatidylinositol glycan class c [Anaeramoeba flamelloides]KAJ6253750.1 phosphatidylinositol glycan [Anaeramoeba flamelloides]
MTEIETQTKLQKHGKEETNKKTKKPWRKILYIQQDYPDNHTDKSFLEFLVLNATSIKRNFSELALDATSITQEVSIVALFLIIFNQSYNNTLSLVHFISINLILIVLGYLLFIFFTHEVAITWWRIFNHLKTFIILFLTLFSLSPVLRTLTKSISNDTIWALAIFLFFLHLFFQDYDYLNGFKERFFAPFSLNAAIFGSVILASRLNSNFLVFILLAFSFQVFALSPLLRHSIKKSSNEVQILSTVLLFTLTFGLIVPINRLSAIIYVFLVACINFGFPLVLMDAQKWKFFIQGPWDCAVVQNTHD